MSAVSQFLIRSFASAFVVGFSDAEPGIDRVSVASYCGHGSRRFYRRSSDRDFGGFTKPGRPQWRRLDDARKGARR
jgi:hypothetical protein